MEPGLLEPMLSAYQGDSKDTSFNLCCDLDGINPSTIDPMGGVDLAGFEPSPTKIELSGRVASEISTLDEGIALGDIDGHACLKALCFTGFEPVS